MEEPFRSKVLPPYRTRMEELDEVVPLLYMNGLSMRKVKRSLKKVLGEKGLSHQTVGNMTAKVVERFGSFEFGLNAETGVYDYDDPGAVTEYDKSYYSAGAGRGSILD